MSFTVTNVLKALLVVALIVVPAYGTYVTETYTTTLSSFAVLDAEGNELAPSRVIDRSELEVNIQIWGFSFMIETHDLTPGDVVTAWGIVFNEPSECTDGVCNSDDVKSNPDAVVSLFNVGGRIIGETGSVKYFNSFGLNEAETAFSGPGLINPEEAEIHVMLVSHGPVQPENLEAQLSTPTGGCDEANPCRNEQFGVIKQN